MAATALALYLLGLGLAFGWRSVVQWRRTGGTGLRLDAGLDRPRSWIVSAAKMLASIQVAASPNPT